MSKTTEELVSNLLKDTPIIHQKPSKPLVDKAYERKTSNMSENNNSVDNEHKFKDIGNIEREKVFVEQQKLIKPKPSAEIRNARVVKNIGFENLPNQIYRRALSTGFELNIMVVGCSGLGKSTFVNSLFLAELYGTDFPPTYQRIKQKQTTEIQSTSVNLTENEVRLCLTLIDTPGFGESIDNRDCWRPVLEYLESRFNEHMLNQSRVDRTINYNDMKDKRVHALLYFLEPTGHQMKPLDIEFLRKIHDRVNVILVIGKADCLMPDECASFKTAILNQVKREGLRIYDFPEEAAVVSLGNSGGNGNFTKSAGTIKEILTKRKRMPFAVVSSNILIDKNGLKVRGRMYPWGIVEVDNMEHNDFPALRALLLSSHLQDLLDTTDLIHYEKYRSEKLSAIAEDSKFGIEEGRDPMSQMDEERRRFEEKIRKMEEDMQALFDNKVAEKTKRYEEKLMQLERSQIDWEVELERDCKEIENRRHQFDQERLLWEEQNRNCSMRASVDTLDGYVKEKKSKSKWLLK